MSELSNEISTFPQKTLGSFMNAKKTVTAFPVTLLKFLSDVGVFIIVVLLLVWVTTGWRVTVGLKKSGLNVSHFMDGGGTREAGMPGNFGGNIPLFDGAGLQRRSAQSDIISLGWNIPNNLQSTFEVGSNRRDGFQMDYDNQLGPNAVAGFGNREPPIFQEVSVDTLRSEDQERDAVAALSKINSERVRRRPEMEYDPLPWKPFWNDWKKEKSDVYSSMTDGPSMVNAPGFFRS